MARVSEKIPELLQRLLKEKNETRYSFSKKHGIPESTFSKVVLGKSKPGIDVLEDICDGFGMSLKAFFSLLYEMDIKEEVHYTNKERDLIEVHRKLNPKKQDMVKAYADGLAEIKK